MMGYDDIKDCSFLRPALTTNHAPVLERGVVGIRRLLEKLGNREGQGTLPQRLVLPGDIIKRGSHKKISG